MEKSGHKFLIKPPAPHLYNQFSIHDVRRVVEDYTEFFDEDYVQIQFKPSTFYITSEDVQNIMYLHNHEVSFVLVREPNYFTDNVLGHTQVRFFWNDLIVPGNEVEWFHKEGVTEHQEDDFLEAAIAIKLFMDSNQEDVETVHTIKQSIKKHFVECLFLQVARRNIQLKRLHKLYDDLHGDFGGSDFDFSVFE